MAPTSAGDDRPSRRPTMADVANRAGVSRTLVSFILDGKPGASEETRQRVLAVAEEIGYRPDSAARLLARGRSRTLGVLMDVRQLFQAELVTGIYPAAESSATRCCCRRTCPTATSRCPSTRCSATGAEV